MEVTAECEKHGACRHRYDNILTCLMCEEENRALSLKEELEAWYAGAYWGLFKPDYTVIRGPAPTEFERAWDRGSAAGAAARLRIENRRAGKDYSLCPYDSHGTDCNCRGMGGDR